MKNPTIFLFAVLTNVCAVFSQPISIQTDFLLQSANIVIAAGQTITNNTGEKLFLFNQRQVNIVHGLVEFAQDEEAFQGRELEIINEFSGYIESTDSLLAKLGSNTLKSKQLADQMKTDYGGEADRLAKSIDRSEVINEQMMQTAKQVGKNTEKLIKKLNTQKVIVKGFTYLSAIAAGIYLGQKIL